MGKFTNLIWILIAVFIWYVQDKMEQTIEDMRAATDERLEVMRIERDAARLELEEAQREAQEDVAVATLVERCISEGGIPARGNPGVVCFSSELVLWEETP